MKFTLGQLILLARSKWRLVGYADKDVQKYIKNHETQLNVFVRLKEKRKYNPPPGGGYSLISAI